MSSERLLNEMPGVVLSAVMAHLDFRSIMRMRKVCHDFRNFIDEVVPSSFMTRIILTVRPYDVELNLEDSKTEVRYTTVYAHRKVWNDLDIILKHRKGLTKKFYLGLDRMGDDMMIDKEVWEEAHSEFLNKLHNNLVARNHPLKVANMRFLISHQHEIMSVLPYIDSEKLERISIFHAQEFERPMLNLDEVVETKQWKNAKQLDISDCYVVEPIKRFAHFEECEVTVKTISLEFLRHLIEILLNHRSLKFVSLEYETYYESEELKRWFEILFDGNRPHNSYKIWYSRIPGSEDNFLEMEAHHSSLLYFSRAELKM
ncbi:unnamed protein product [Caenorhabditis nigoni]